MRVQDSLERGISYFMAELRRLKEIVDRADRQGPEGSHRPVRALLYLLDEILLGTNTVERQAAAHHVILHLARTGAIGAVSTHDLTLAASPEMARIARPVHFQETFSEGPDGKTMTFDYHLHPGLSTTTNALRLMELVGLPFEE
jgi:DNA mismatch repair ATPase MutS